VPSSPGRKSKIREALDRRIGKPGENRGQIVAYGDVDATTGFDGGEDGSDFGSGWLADPVPPMAERAEVNFGEVYLQREFNAPEGPSRSRRVTISRFAVSNPFRAWGPW